VEFRERLLGTLRQFQPVLDEPGVIVAGSEVPNLLQGDAASTLVVSEDVDIAVPVSSHGSVKQRLAHVSGFRPAPEEPSVWLPDDPSLIEVNFIGIDRRLKSAAESYVLDDPELPLLVFGQLSLLRQDAPFVIEGVRVPLPRKAGLMLEKLLTDRAGVKGDRDLLVVAGLLQLSNDQDLAELVQLCSELGDEEERKHAGSARVARDGRRHPASAGRGEMTGSASVILERRLREMRARVQIRSWEYRQRHRSKGVWYRLRRMLAEAERAFVVSAEDARQLIREGFVPAPVGDELHPNKTILVVPAERAERLASRQETPVRLSLPLLEARQIVLVPFAERPSLAR
jgi:hypothetical protein